MSTRREFIALAGASAVAWPLGAMAQQAGRVWRIAYVANNSQPGRLQVIFDGLGDFGYVNGKNLTVEVFDAPSVADVPAYAARAVAGKPDIIVTAGSAAPLAVKEITSTIPVVMTGLQDPVEIGAVASYARPGGNITGFMQGGPLYYGKQIELIREVLPTLSRLAVLGLPVDPAYPAQVGGLNAGAKALGIEIIEIGANEGEDLVLLFDSAAKSGAQAIIISNAGYLKLNYKVIADLALRHQLPAFHVNSIAVSDGLLLAFSANSFASTRKAMSYVDAILKGAKPADLPIQLPTVFDLAINLKTARALGITIPPSLLLQATEVIE